MKQNEYEVLKITKKQKKYRVEFSQDLEIILTEDQMVEFRIIKGLIYNEETINKLKQNINISNLYNKTLNYIDFKPRTKKEVVEYLKKHEAFEDTISYIIDKLEKITYIDDERYTKSFVLECIRKQKGRNYIIQTLHAKGINKEKVLQYLDEYSIEQEIENAYKIASKYSLTITKNPIKKQQLQISNKLLQVGFSYDVISKVINQLELIDNSNDSLLKDYQKMKLKDYTKNEIVQKLLAKGYDYQDVKKVLDD